WPLARMVIDKWLDLSVLACTARSPAEGRKSLATARGDAPATLARERCWMSAFASAWASALALLSTTGLRRQPTQADNFFRDAERFARTNENLGSTKDRTLSSIAVLELCQRSGKDGTCKLCTLVPCAGRKLGDVRTGQLA